MIPKKAYFVYGEHNENPLDERGKTNIEKFKELNPDWEVEFITLENSPEQYKHIYHWNKLAWSQVVRFYLVHEHGGLYSDVDIVFYGKMLGMEGCDLVVATETHGGVTDAFFACEKGNAIIGKCLHNSVQWCHEKMVSGVDYVTTDDLFHGAGIIMFCQTVKEMTGFCLYYQDQIHMTEEDFNGNFVPEKGVGILPFEALSRHSEKNWIGWHQCWGTWRPGVDEGKCDMSMEARIQVISGNDYSARNWDRLASETPYFWVLTDPKYKQGADATFWDSGRELANYIECQLQKVIPSIEDLSVVELGVGVGRIARSISSRSKSFIGLDISPNMLAICKQHHPEMDVRLVTDEDLPEADIYYSQITLQHCIPPLIKTYLHRMMQASRKAIYLQLYDQQDKGSDFGGVTMHGLSPSEVLSIARENGWHPFSVLKDGSAGPTMDSYQYLLTKTT